MVTIAGGIILAVFAWITIARIGIGRIPGSGIFCSIWPDS